MKQRIILLDFETGGLSCKDNPITEVALVVYDSATFKVLDQFETYVKPYGDLKIEKEALKRTGISLSDLNKGTDIKVVVNAIATLCKKHTPKGDKGGNKPIIAGHNIIFDIGFMKEAFKFVGKKAAEHWASSGEEISYIDTMVLSKHRWKPDSDTSSYNLGACLKRIGEEVIGAHKAMNDVIANGKLLKFLLTAMRGNETVAKSKNKGEVEVLSGEGKEFRSGFEM